MVDMLDYALVLGIVGVPSWCRLEEAQDHVYTEESLLLHKRVAEGGPQNQLSPAVVHLPCLQKLFEQIDRKSVV